MIDLSADWYLWIKALHIISVIAWMAGMLYLPRLYVYHCGAAPGSELSETLKVMERRLLCAIINPAMAAAVILGGILLANLDDDSWSDVWLWVKLVCIFFMGGMHGALSKWHKDFEADKNTKSAKFYRWANEAPTVLFILIVIMVVVKPF